MRSQKISIHGAASRANPKIPNFKKSIAAARRDFGRKPLGSSSVADRRPGPRQQQQQQQDQHFGVSRGGHISSALRRGSLVAVGIDGTPVGHHEHPSEQHRQQQPRRQSVTAQLGIHRVDPKTLRQIQEHVPLSQQQQQQQQQSRTNSTPQDHRRNGSVHTAKGYPLPITTPNISNLMRGASQIPPPAPPAPPLRSLRQAVSHN